MAFAWLSQVIVNKAKNIVDQSGIDSSLFF